MTAVLLTTMSQIELLFRAPKDPDSNARYDGGDSYTEVLPAGYRRSPDARPFELSTVYEKDVKIPMRDGPVLRADIFRPEDTQCVPAILPWSPYGKSGRGKTIEYYKLIWPLTFLTHWSY